MSKDLLCNKIDIEEGSVEVVHFAEIKDGWLRLKYTELILTLSDQRELRKRVLSSLFPIIYLLSKGVVLEKESVLALSQLQR